MDEKDFEILKILDRNCRTSYSKIAESVDLSLRNVSSRIDNLIESEVIKCFTVQFNYNYLGFRHYIGSINQLQEKKIKNFFEKLQLIPEIYRIWELLDGSLTISFFCKNAKHLETIINNIVETGAILNDYVETRIHFPADIPYSPTDWRLIFFLLKNSRASKKDIAFNLNISEKTVKRRLQRIESMKLAQFITEINFEAISNMITPIISLETVGPSKEIYLNIKKDKAIKFWRSAGSVSPSIVLFLYGKSVAEIYEMYLKLRDREDIKTAKMQFVVRNWQNSSIIEDALLEKIQNS
ncbi:MAG: winged helix-turn-helix transcriptional regulator [Candidatus Hodarchaeota archaeon]